jgi:hypothetical protein
VNGQPENTIYHLYSEVKRVCLIITQYLVEVADMKSFSQGSERLIIISYLI